VGAASHENSLPERLAATVEASETLCEREQREQASPGRVR
jgi:hypothetical protein